MTTEPLPPEHDHGAIVPDSNPGFCTRFPVSAWAVLAMVATPIRLAAAMAQAEAITPTRCRARRLDLSLNGTKIPHR
jgi:hypothetical protein